MHRHPEVGLVLPVTRDIILTELEGLPLQLTRHEKTSGIVAVLDAPGSNGPVTLLRADHDGLPIVEDTGLVFASETGTAMHACGHDLHTAMLIAAAQIIVERQEDLVGPVVLMFQPGEEGHHGARFMMDEGVLDAAGRRVDRAFATHVFSTIESGVVGLRSGAVMAGSDQFHISLIGAGGHASTPHRALDPVPAAAELVLAMQSALSRRTSVFEPSVVTFAHIEAGSAPNIIPDRAKLHGTIRTFSSESRRTVHDLLRQVAGGIAAAHGLEADVIIDRGYPVTVNDAAETGRIQKLASRMGASVVELDDPLTVSEDWSYILEEVPGVMAMLGARPPASDPATTPMNHSDRVDFDEAAMPVGAALYAAAALGA